MKVVQSIARAVAAMLAAPEGSDERIKHANELADLIDLFPGGDGLSTGVTYSPECTSERLEFATHFQREDGSFAEHRVIVTPSLVDGYEMTVVSFANGADAEEQTELVRMMRAVLDTENPFKS